MHVTESTLDTSGAVRLHLRITAPDGDPRGILILVHGHGEHCARYDHVAARLAAAGLIVYAYDQRGHGRSTGLRGHADGFGEYTDDLRRSVDAAREAFGSELPLVIYGHSMGGLIVLSYLLDYPDTPAVGFVASNPLIRTAFQPPKLKVAAGRMLSRLLPRLRLDSELDASGISRDPAEVEKYTSDPHVHSLVSTRWFTSMTKAAARVEEEATQITVPGLWILSGSDAICDSAAARSVAQKTRTAEISDYPDSFHEPHNDLDREQVIGDLCAWVTGRL